MFFSLYNKFDIQTTSFVEIVCKLIIQQDGLYVIFFYLKSCKLLIIETFEERGINPEYTPAVLCKNHGPFTWGHDAAEAVHNAVVLEEVAKMARNTEALNPQVKVAPDSMKEKHFYRKHGADAYYGQL